MTREKLDDWTNSKKIFLRPEKETKHFNAERLIILKRTITVFFNMIDSHTYIVSFFYHAILFYLLQHPQKSLICKLMGKDFETFFRGRINVNTNYTSYIFDLFRVGQGSLILTRQPTNAESSFGGSAEFNCQVEGFSAKPSKT